MSFRVVVTETAKQELSDAADWWARNRSVEQARVWYAGLSDEIYSLSENPDRFPLSRENHRFKYELREIHFGIGSHSTHRAVFTIGPDYVIVLRVRHHAQRDLTNRDLPRDPFVE